MRIKISNDDTRFKIIIPTSMIFNPLGFAISKKVMKNNAIDLTGVRSRDAHKIYAVIRKCKRMHPDWRLVEVWSEGEKVVEIKL